MSNYQDWKDGKPTYLISNFLGRIADKVREFVDAIIWRGWR